MTAAEEWRPVVGFPQYEVSNLGRIRRVGPSRSGTTFDGKVLKPINKGNGYQVVSPVRDGKNHARYVHRLVAEAFLGPVPPDCEVNHKDCDKANNRRENLEYVTRGENMSHSHSSGRVPKGSGKSQAKLTEAIVAGIRRERPSSQADFDRLAKLHSVSPSTVRDAAAGRRWKHVK